MDPEFTFFPRGQVSEVGPAHSQNSNGDSDSKNDSISIITDHGHGHSHGHNDGHNNVNDNDKDNHPNAPNANARAEAGSTGGVLDAVKSRLQALEALVLEKEIENRYIRRIYLGGAAVELQPVTEKEREAAKAAVEVEMAMKLAHGNASGRK